MYVWALLKRQRKAQTHLRHRIFIVGSLTALYWMFSGGLTLYNKYLLTSFRFPILLICCTYTINFAFAASFRLLSRWLCPNRVKLQTVSRRVFVRYIIPIGLFSALEIGTSNISLLTLSVSFHTMVQASKPAFVLLWSIALGLEPLQWQLVGIVSLVALGVLLVSVGESAESIQDIGSPDVPTVPGFQNSTVAATAAPTASQASSLVDTASELTAENKFSLAGFLFVLFSCFCSGARWSITQLMLHSALADVQDVDNAAGIELSEVLDEDDDDAAGVSSMEPGHHDEGLSSRGRPADHQQRHRYRTRSHEYGASSAGGGASLAPAPSGQMVAATAAASPAGNGHARIGAPPAQYTDEHRQVLEEDEEWREAKRSRQAGTRHALSPLNLLYFVSPVCIGWLVPAFFTLEFSAYQNYVATMEPDSSIAGFIFVCGTMALGLILVEFMFIRVTSSLSLSIAAIFKELLLVFSAALIWGDQLSALNVLGFGVCLLGIMLYNWHFYRRMKAKAGLSVGSGAAISAVPSTARSEPLGSVGAVDQFDHSGFVDVDLTDDEDREVVVV